MGVSVGIFFAGLSVLLLASQHAKLGWRSGLPGVALLACCVQAGVEVSLSNVLASAVLLLALAGEVFHGQIAGRWARISEVLYGFATAPVRWFGISATAAVGIGELRLPGSGSSDSPRVRCG